MIVSQADWLWGAARSTDGVTILLFSYNLREMAQILPQRENN